MDVADDVGAGEDEDLGTVLPAVEVLEGEAAGLDLGAHGTVEQQHPFAQMVEKAAHAAHALRPLEVSVAAAAGGR
ncbi:hypothetical protein HRbin39_01222 [bacterium HR39]|nr:hypothetical protein HRbin39_01222 [bacterium HR39]